MVRCDHVAFVTSVENDAPPGAVATIPFAPMPNHGFTCQGWRLASAADEPKTETHRLNGLTFGSIADNSLVNSVSNPKVKPPDTH